MSGDFVESVLEWNRAAGRTEGEFNVRAVALHTGLQLEELDEKLEAMHLALTAEAFKRIADDFKSGVFDSAVSTADPVALLDADCDIAVVTVGSLQAQGANAHGALQEVTDSNNSKHLSCSACGGSGGVGEGWHDPCLPCGGRGWILEKDANGKITKGPDYRAPDLRPFVSSGSLQPA